MLLSLILGYLAVLGTTASTFDPLAYKKSTVGCNAIRRGLSTTQETENYLKYVNINPTMSPTLLLVHGWPGLWSSWSKQIEEFGKDYHLLVPDLRGFGESSHPGNPQSSGAMPDLLGDLICILNHARVSSVVCMGHDWGSALCYEAARRRPDIFIGVIGVVVPYIPADGPFMPTNELGSLFETLKYQAFFNSNPEAAAKELSKDVRRTIRATLRTADSAPPPEFLRSNESYLQAWGQIEIPPVPFFSPQEEDYFVLQYESSGFENTLQFYSNENRFLSWQSANRQGNHTILQPVLAVYPTEDPVGDWEVVATLLKSVDHIPNLTTKTMPGAHWVHLEHPIVFNHIVREWLDSRLHKASRKHVIDEL